MKRNYVQPRDCNFYANEARCIEPNLDLYNMKVHWEKCSRKIYYKCKKNYYIQ